MRRLSPERARGEKPNPISIPGPWSCGQRTARGFFLCKSRGQESRSRESKVNEAILSTSDKDGRLSLALEAGGYSYCCLDTGSTKLEMRPSPLGRGSPATAFLPAGAGRAFARRPVARRRLWAAGRRVMDAQGTQPATARLPSPRLREARRGVRGPSHSEGYSPDESGRQPPPAPSLTKAGNFHAQWRPEGS